MSSINPRPKHYITDTAEETNNNSYSKDKEVSRVEIDDGDKLPTEIIYPCTTTKKTSNKKELNIQPTTKSTTFSGKKTKKKEIRPENIRNSAFYYPMIFLKKLFKIQFKLDFDLFKCSEVFGVSICHMRQILNLQMYQILSYYPKYYNKIIKFSKRKMSKEKKYMFYYFMTRTYEELYIRYVEGNVNFPCIPNGTLRIGRFTLNRTIKEKIEEFKKKKEDKDYSYNWIKKFFELSENMIEDLKNGKNERIEKSKIQFIPVVVEDFDDMRNNFL